MAYVEIYRGDTKTLALQFTQPNGSPMNVSGYAVFLGAAINYSSSPVLYVGTTGTDSASVTGLINLVIDSGYTNLCPQVYVANIRTISPSGIPATWPLDGLNILPTVLPTPSP